MAADLASGALGGTTSEGAFGTGANSARIASFRPYETLSKTKMSRVVGIDLSSPPDGLGVLAFRGADAAKFLQGQLSADIEKLGIGVSTFAGLHNPQGRVIALLALTRTAVDEVLAVLPRELVSAIETRLRKYVLRSKVRIEDLSETLRVLGSVNAPSLPEIHRLSWADRWVLLVPADHPDVSAAETTTRAHWDRADIAAGLPQVYLPTSETFVAQMLNLDLLGAIAFDKGCYTGQEVVARAHYRGRVKRRLQRWHAPPGPEPRPGASVRAADGRSLTVVRAAVGEEGGWDLLAVGNFAAAEPSDETGGVAEAGVLVVEPRPLPYSLPE
jgi:tRNA-modifying protein YgfZ